VIQKDDMYVWLLLLVSTCAVLTTSCSSRKVVIDEVKKDSLSQIVTKIVTNEVVDLKVDNNIITDEFTVTPLDTCKDIVVNGIKYRNVILKYKKTKDTSIHTEKKIVAKVEDKKQTTKVVEKKKKKDVERKSFDWIILLILLLLLWLSKQNPLSLLKRL